jgi:hypothetical protein
MQHDLNLRNANDYTLPIVNQELIKSSQFTHSSTLGITWVLSDFRLTEWLSKYHQSINFFKNWQLRWDRRAGLACVSLLPICKFIIIFQLHFRNCASASTPPPLRAYPIFYISYHSANRLNCTRGRHDNMAVALCQPLSTKSHILWYNTILCTSIFCYPKYLSNLYITLYATAWHSIVTIRAYKCKLF